MLTAALSSLWKTRTRFGWGALGRRIVDSLARRGLRAGVVEVVWLPLEAAPLAPPDWPGWSFRLLTPEEVDAFSRDPSLDMGPEMAIRMRERGDACFGIIDGERLASYGWYARRPIDPEPGEGNTVDYPGLTFPSDVAYMYKGFSRSDYRGRGLHALEIGLALRALAPQGVRALVSTVYWTNEASVRSCRRLGMTFLGRIVQYSLFGRYRLRVPAALRQHGIEFFHDALQSTAASTNPGAPPAAAGTNSVAPSASSQAACA